MFIGPLVPDGNVVFFEIADVGSALQKPEQLMDHRGQVNFLGGKQRKAVLQVKTHLMAKQRQGPRARAVIFRNPALKNGLQQVKINFHATIIKHVK
jgi:hypothetical protein